MPLGEQGPYVAAATKALAQHQHRQHRRWYCLCYATIITRAAAAVAPMTACADRWPTLTHELTFKVNTQSYPIYSISPKPRHNYVHYK